MEEGGQAKLMGWILWGLLFVITVAKWPGLLLLFGRGGNVLPGQTVGGEFENEEI